MKNKEEQNLASPPKEEAIEAGILYSGNPSPFIDWQRELKSPRFFIDKNRFTYTFLIKGEAASIHFDAMRNEIFYRGHNIRNMSLSELEVDILRGMFNSLLEYNQGFLALKYKECLSKIINP